jgi:branched-chain amino acid transport system permease protein
MKPLKIPLISFFVLAMLGLALDYSVNDYVQLTILFFLVNSLLSMSLNLVSGYTGQFSLGHAGFMAIGAYTTAFLSDQLISMGISWGAFNFLITIFAAGVLASIAGFLVGQPSLRLKGDYLAIVTLGFGEIVRVVLLNLDFLGGARGYSGIASIGGFFTSYLVAIFWLLICFFLVYRLIKSSHGRSFLSVREDEIAAESLGINTTQAKVRAFMLSSFFAGVGGALFAHFTAYISPASFTFLQSVNVVIMVVLGGMGSLLGSIAGAFLVTVLPEILRELKTITIVDLRMIIYSLTLILMMILRPQGLFGEIDVDYLWRKYAKKPSQS